MSVSAKTSDVLFESAAPWIIEVLSLTCLVHVLINHWDILSLPLRNPTKKLYLCCGKDLHLHSGVRNIIDILSEAYS